MEQRLWIWIKRHASRDEIARSSGVDHLMDQILVTSMDAIEDADGQSDRRSAFLHAFTSVFVVARWIGARDQPEHWLPEITLDFVGEPKKLAARSINARSKEPRG